VVKKKIRKKVKNKKKNCQGLVWKIFPTEETQKSLFFSSDKKKLCYRPR
jgi:hypothetical protein